MLACERCELSVRGEGEKGEAAALKNRQRKSRRSNRLVLKIDEEEGEGQEEFIS